MTKKTRWLFFVLCVLPWRYLCFFDFGIWQPILYRSSAYEFFVLDIILERK
jgi:hypothetical protein